VTSLYPTEYLRRCLRCGRRSTIGPARSLVLGSCVECGIPYLIHGAADPRRACCEDCSKGHLPSDLPDRQVAEATEREVVAALERAWSFVAAPSLSVYLDRLAARIRGRMDTGLATSGVALFEEARFWTLALPSGRLLLSLGAVSGLEDEAELAFVLAHELAHASSIDASARLVRLGLRIVAQEQRHDLGRAWSDTAHDVIRVGYGRAREREADRRAFRTVVAMGYDPRSVFSYLGRLGQLVENGDPRVAELALGHPLPAERRRWLEAEGSALAVGRSPCRVNREVFRRAAGHEAQLARLEHVDALAAAQARPAEDSTAERRRRGVWLAVSLVFLAVLLVVAASYLT
jgi:predicted Zn-dependent protease